MSIAESTPKAEARRERLEKAVDDAAKAPAPEAAPIPAPEKPTIGEKIWYASTYTGVGYLANLGISVVLWDYFISGKGKPVYHAIQQGVEHGLKGVGVGHSTAERWASVIAKYIFSPLGGHIATFLVNPMEHAAAPITHWNNVTFDPNYQYKHIPINTPDDQLPPLANPPNKNTWAQIAARRGMGWAAVIGSGMALNASGFEKPLEEGTLKAFDKAIKMTGSKALERMAATPYAQRIMPLIALDSYLTVVTAAITAATKNTFGNKDDASVADDALSIDIPHVTVNPVKKQQYNKAPAVTVAAQSISPAANAPGQTPA